MKSILTATAAQKILDFLILSPETQYVSSEIQNATKVSRAGTNFALRDLTKAGLVKRERRGRLYLYSVDFHHPVVKQLKVLKAVISICGLAKRLAKQAKKIVLYGSSSRGEDMRDSDIDLFVATNTPEARKRTVEKDAMGRRIQLTTRTPLEYAEMKKTDPTFYGEVERGIVLWESRDES